jgi:hypothetical protein
MRLFTFGCSMTAYHYPTWADIVGTKFKNFQNWGKGSCGNNYILNAINRCHLQNKFTKDDTVLVLWSGLSRIDYYQIDNWASTMNQYHDFSNRDLPYSCPDGYQWLSFAYMASAIHMLENLGVNFKMFHWQKFDTDTEPYQLYQSVLKKIIYSPFSKNKFQYFLHPQSQRTANEAYDRCAGEDWPPLSQILDGSYTQLNLDSFIQEEIKNFLATLSKDKSISSSVFETRDDHPSPLKHLEWVNTYLLEYTITQTTVDWLADIDIKLRQGLPYDFVESSLA